ncbi:IS30 family transposase [Streptomyces sp. NRRL S-87]|uniref:IS30 family transposase n=1 Tax=Streptomyces sp. NRRL S-87 TaxID=1463920 RepID=UPI0004BF5520|nr:IS30 family transposase [Streptomyces sp. NRRL S-87]
MDFKIREIRTAQGPKKLVRERETYFRLMQQGLSNEHACQIVGVNEKTGRRWRHGRSPQVKRKAGPAHRPVVPPAGVSRYLHEGERIYIADRVREKASVRAIAAELGRSPSTVSREIRRNRSVDARGRWYYRPYAAQARADARRRRPKPSKIRQNPELRDFIQAGLGQRWSPQQICQALRMTFPDRPEMHVVHETVYQALYIQGRGELRREVARALRSGRTRRMPQRQENSRQPRFKDPMIMISDRPAEVEDRAVPGHWEGDLIIGKDGASAIGTLVERATRYVMLLHLPDGRSAEHVRDALVTTVKTLPGHLVRSLTWDQGSEMAAHVSFTLATDVPVYFCDPASPWQRGSNENTNGLLRQYFPKGTDLTAHTREHLDAVAAELNGRPRKTLNWETPAQRLHKLLAA